MKWLSLILLAGVSAGEGYQLMHPAENRLSTAVKVLPVDHLPEYVIGFPVYVAITVRADPDTSLNRLRFADFINLRESIGVEIELSGGGDAVRYQPHPVAPETGGERLGPGETRRMLADVSPLLGAGIVAGEYRARFTYVTPRATYAAPPATMRFRLPTAAEDVLLTAAAPDRARFPNWALWTMSCSHDVYAGPIGLENPLRFGLVLQRLLCGPDSPDRVDPRILDVLTGLFEPERNALEAELYHARNDLESYQRIRAGILGTPGLAWWIRMLDQGGAYLKTFARKSN